MKKNIELMEKNFISYVKRYISQNSLVHATDQIFNFFEFNGLDYYIVGGIIRDYFMGKIPKDIDISFEGDFESLVYFMEQNISNHFIVNKKFNTIKIFVNSSEIDIINCRTERYLFPGALPEVSPDSIYEDMRRRDITVNSIAYSMKNKKFIDILGGIDDIKEKSIKLNNQSSFYDDPSRIYRIIKYKNRCGFNYDEYTEVVLKEAIKENLLSNISIERKLNEFVKILDERNLEKIFSELYQLGLLKEFLPNFQYNEESISKINEFEKFKSKTESKLLMLYYVFDFNVSYAINTFTFSKNLKIDFENILNLKNDIRNLSINSSNSEIYYTFSKYSDILLKVAYVFEKSKIREHIDFYSKILRHVQCPINGNDLINLGVKDTVDIRRILRLALEDTLNDKNLMLTKNEILMKYVDTVKIWNIK